MNPEVAAYLESLRAAQEAAGPMESLPELRAWYRELMAGLPATPLPAGFTVEQQQFTSAGTELAMLVQRPGAGRRPAVLYFHGGGFALGDPSATADATMQLAQTSGSVVLSADYRLAPEHPYPAAHDDAVAALEWVWAHAESLGIDSERLAVAGDSAGGALALHAALSAQAAGRPVAALVLFYGWFVYSLESESMQRLGPTDAVLPTPLMEMFRAAYFGDADAARAAEVRRVPGLGDTCLIYGDTDPLSADSEALARLLSDSGTQVEAHRFGGMPHGFSTIPVLTDGRRSVALAGAFLTARTGQA
jgi:acetyl esterase